MVGDDDATVRPAGRLRESDWEALLLWLATRLGLIVLGTVGAAMLFQGEPIAPFLDRLRRWDADHLIEIARYGYAGDPAQPVPQVVRVQLAGATAAGAADRSDGALGGWSGAGMRGFCAAFIGLNITHPHRSAAEKALESTAWHWRIDEAASGRHSCGAHRSSQSCRRGVRCSTNGLPAQRRRHVRSSAYSRSYGRGPSFASASVRAQLAGASERSNSDVPASLKPPSIGVATNRDSPSVTGTRTSIAGSGISM